MIFSMTKLNELAKTLAIISYTPFTTLMGRESLTFTAPTFLGTRAMKVALSLFSQTYYWYENPRIPAYRHL